jgi:hypothetical protein
LAIMFVCTIFLTPSQLRRRPDCYVCTRRRISIVTFNLRAFLKKKLELSLVRS